MDIKTLFEKSLNDEDNLTLQKELNKIDNLIETTFHSRYDNCLKQDEKKLNKIKLYYYNDEFESEDNLRQKSINKLSYIFCKNKKNKEIKSQFKPLTSPKQVSLKGKVFFCESKINSD